MTALAGLLLLLGLAAAPQGRFREAGELARQGDWTSHPEVRDVEAAGSSTKRLLRLARKTGKRIHVLHVTTGEEMLLLSEAKDVATCEINAAGVSILWPSALRNRLRPHRFGNVVEANQCVN